jgi:hypothetical protein
VEAGGGVGAQEDVRALAARVAASAAPRAR